MISQVLGDDAECYTLDGRDNVIWLPDPSSIERYAFFLEGMDYPFNVRRYSKAVIVGLGDNPWGSDTIAGYLRWFVAGNSWGDMSKNTDTKQKTSLLGIRTF